MSEERTFCEACDAALPPGEVSGTPPRYCSNACRQRAYRRRQRAPAAHPLPQRIDRFVGRRRELAELAALLRQTRLVTLVGPPGAGKTRLAVELANRIRGRYPDGVYLVPLHQASRVVPAVAAGLAGPTPGPATTANAGAGAPRCRRLGGLPLGRELAARRVRLRPPDGMVPRLHDRFALLTAGARPAPPRHRSLWAAMTWSYDLLPPGEQAAFRRLSVFSGAFDVDAAEVVLSGLDGVPADLLAALEARSLVLRADGGAAPAPFRMLESVRWYAHRQLLGHLDAAAPHDGHVAYPAALARPGFCHPGPAGAPGQ